MKTASEIDAYFESFQFRLEKAPPALKEDGSKIRWLLIKDGAPEGINWKFRSLAHLWDWLRQIALPHFRQQLALRLITSEYLRSDPEARFKIREWCEKEGWTDWKVEGGAKVKLANQRIKSSRNLPKRWKEKLQIAYAELNSRHGVEEPSFFQQLLEKINVEERQRLSDRIVDAKTPRKVAKRL